MKIKVLGTGCASCKALFQTVETAVKETGIDAQVIKEEDLMQIMSYNVLSMPGLVIDDVVVSSGKKLSLEEVKSLILNK